MANAVIAFTVVTIVFAVFERLKDSSGFLTNWSPRELPPVRNTERIPHQLAFRNGLRTHLRHLVAENPLGAYGDGYQLTGGFGGAGISWIFLGIPALKQCVPVMMR